MTQQLCKPSPLPQWPSLPNLLFSTRGHASPHRGQPGKKNLGGQRKYWALESERAARHYSGLFPRIPENHCSPLPPNPPFPHMSHPADYSYSVIWKSNSSLLSVPSPAVHKERTVRSGGGDGGERHHPGETRNLVSCEIIPGPKPHSLQFQTTLSTALPKPTLGLVSAPKQTPSFQLVSPPQPGVDTCSVKTPTGQRFVQKAPQAVST